MVNYKQEMKINYLQLKIVGGILFFCSLIFFAVFYLVGFYQKEMFSDLAKNQAYSSTKYLQSVFRQPADFSDETKVQEIVYSLGSSYPNLVKADVNLMQEGKIKTVSSLDFSLVGKDPGEDNYNVFQKGISKEGSVSIPGKQGSFFRVITPIKISGAGYGTYEIIVSLDPFPKSLDSMQQKVLQSMIFGLALLALLLFAFLNNVVLKPIKKLEKGVELFSKGKFDYRIDEKGSDEFSRLAKGLNDMSKELFKSYDSLEDAIGQRTKELEEARTVLEIKVRARTRQLQEMNDNLEGQVKEKTVELQSKIKDLEKFNNLMIDREMRMLELKKEIEKMKSGKK